jgi:valine--pyruvate aminotransferase
MNEQTDFAKQIGSASGISRLMDDLGKNSLSSHTEVVMLGGGNPAHIPEVQDRIRQALLRIANDKGHFARLIGNYDPPEGNLAFAQLLADSLNEQLGWPIGPENIALTNGSQSAFFALFNLLAGSFDSGVKKKILLPLEPEYIGYADIGIEHDMFVCAKPRIDFIDEHTFKYYVDFDRVERILMEQSIGAICVSRPTNPTGNVLTDSEIEQLSDLAKTHRIPFIIDNAYGLPFPGVVYTDAKPYWDEQAVVCMSLSKLGLPGARTGIVIANRDIVESLSHVNAVTNLAPGSMGPVLATEFFKDTDLWSLCKNVIKPYYDERGAILQQQLTEQLQGVNFHLHKREGAFFLWLWIPGLPISSMELYYRLKEKSVIIVPGEYFFPGSRDQWDHKHECMRISSVQDEAILCKGAKIIAHEIKSLFKVKG